MLSEQLIQKIESLAEDIATREGCRLYDIEFAGSGQGRILRVYIDKLGGAGIEDCSNVSRGLNLILDVEDVIPGGAYSLEVSTPGLDRVLRKPWHFTEAVGKKIWMKTSKSLGDLGMQSKKLQSAKQLSELVASTTETGVNFLIENENVFVPFDVIEKAKMVFEFKEKGKKKTH